MTAALLLAALLAILPQQGVKWDNNEHPWIEGSWWYLTENGAAMSGTRHDWYESDTLHRTLKIYPHRWFDLPANTPVSFCVHWAWWVDGEMALSGPGCVNFEWPDLCNLDYETPRQCAGRMRPSEPPQEPE